MLRSFEVMFVNIKAVGVCSSGNYSRKYERWIV
jgi:hypothetical protein